jgi:plastocyanin
MIAAMKLLLAALLVGTSLLPTGARAAVLQLTIQGADGKPATDTVVMWRRAGGFQAFGLHDPAVITQKDIRFSPYVTVVPMRSKVRFVNKDRFAHHIRSMPSGPLGSVPAVTDFEFRLAAPRGAQETSAEVQLDNAGAIQLGCHLHGSMRAHIYVSATPWAVVTDDQGRATLDVPDGAGELLLWHPDQVLEQPAKALQAEGTVAARQSLNFSPRRRPPPRSTSQSDYTP